MLQSYGSTVTSHADARKVSLQLIGRPHIRKDRANTFPTLDILHNVTHDRPGETSRYTSASVLDILGYLADEAARGNMTKVLASEMGSDAQAVLIAASAQATLRCLRGGQLHHCFTEPLPSSREVRPVSGWSCPELFQSLVADA